MTMKREVIEECHAYRKVGYGASIVCLAVEVGTTKGSVSRQILSM